MNRGNLYHVAVAGMALVASLALVGCGITMTTAEDAIAQQRNAHVGNTVEGLHTDGVLSVGLRNSTAAPLVVDANGKMTGLDVEAASILADKLGVSAKFYRVVNVQEALDDTCDIVMDVSVPSSSAEDDEESADTYQVMGDLSESAVALFHKGEPGVVTANELKNKSVAVQNQSASQVLLKSASVKVKEVPCDTLEMAFKQLETGSVDYVLCHAMSGAYLCTHYDDISFAGTINEPVVSGIATSASAPALTKSVQEAYDQASSDGTLPEAYRRWLGELPHLTNESEVTGFISQEKKDDADMAALAESVGSGAQDGSSAGANAATVSTLEQNEE